MPATTTQILFNSPALHSLKRDQLVKLCKIHSIKASGKNVELIEKLKRHAETLPKDDPLSIAVRGESSEHVNEVDHDMNGMGEGVDRENKQGMVVEAQASSSSTPEGSQPARPPLKPTFSDWEVVMYSIAEEDENQGTVGSTRSGHRGTAGEFGTSSSKSTVGSSIKALANSIGKLKKGPKSPKRNGSVKHSTRCDASDELEKHSLRYDSLPPSVPPKSDEPLAFNPARMSTDGFLAAGESPLPGHALRPGVPAPENGRLSLGLSGAPVTPSLPTTTIRLIGDRKTPEPANPSNRSIAATPQLKPFETNFDLIMGSPGGSDGTGGPASSIYPTLTFNDLPPSLTSMAKAAPVRPSSSTTPLPGGASEADSAVPVSRASDDPFVFGSPLPKNRVSDAQFKSAAASVLEEMNKRLQVDGVAGVDTGLIARLHPGAHKKASLPPKEVNPLPKGEMKEKFDQVHKQEFRKMEGIDAFVKRKEAAKEVMTASAIIGKKRKSSVVPREGPRRPPGTRVSGTRAISNGRRAMAIPGAFGVENDDEDETQDGEHPEERAGKRIRVASDAVDTKDDAGNKQTEEEEQAAREKERQVIKRKLEMNKAKRRSSTGPGLHGKRVSRPSMSAKASPKPKFGFLSSAKSLVASVLGRGKTDAATSNAIPKPITQSKPATSLFKKGTTPAKLITTQAPAARPTGVKPSSESTLNKPTAVSSARLRSPIPTFGLGSTRGNAAPTTNSLTATAATSRKVSATTTSRVSSAQVSSMGTRVSTVQPTNTGAVGSMGSKKMFGATGSQASRLASTPSSSSRLPITSRLFAPTASSLAKMGKNSGLGLRPLTEPLTPAQALKSPPGSRRNTAALDIITNSPAKPDGKAHATFSPTKGKIFSQPLELVAPTPAKTAGAASVVSPGDDDLKSPSIRQRSLNGKRPRVSRSKVIAKLASQRAAGASSIPTAAPRASVAATPRRGSVLAPKAGGKPRSSLGAKVVRNGIAGAKVADGPSNGVMMSAKKRVRQSEYYRRRSVAASSSPVKPRVQQSVRGDDAMDVDQ